MGVLVSSSLLAATVKKKRKGKRPNLHEAEFGLPFFFFLHLKQDKDICFLFLPPQWNFIVPIIVGYVFSLSLVFDELD